MSCCGAEHLGRLYLVATPRADQSEEEFLARIQAALDGGVDTLQLRCKNWEAEPYIQLAKKVCALARAKNVPFFVNDRVDVAMASDADGVHLGQSDLQPDLATNLAPKLMIGRSTHQPKQANAAQHEPIDYFAVGPIHATPTKPGRLPVGLEYVRYVAQMNPVLPWYAIGGINREAIEPVLEAGAQRVAIVRAVLDARDPAKAANELISMLNQVELILPASCQPKNPQA